MPTLSELEDFDPAEFLSSPEAIQAYLDEAAQTGDPAFISDALGVVARVQRMTKLTKQAQA